MLAVNGCLRKFLLLKEELLKCDQEKKQIKQNLERELDNVREWCKRYQIGAIDVASCCRPEDKELFQDLELRVRHRTESQVKHKVFPLSEDAQLQHISHKFNEVYGQKIAPELIKHWIEVKQAEYNLQRRLVIQNQQPLVRTTKATITVRKKRKPAPENVWDSVLTRKKQKKNNQDEKEKDDKEEKEEKSKLLLLDYRDKGLLSSSSDTESLHAGGAFDWHSASEDDETISTRTSRSPHLTDEIQHLAVNTSPLSTPPPLQLAAPTPQPAQGHHRPMSLPPKTPATGVTPSPARQPQPTTQAVLPPQPPSLLVLSDPLLGLSHRAKATLNAAPSALNAAPPALNAAPLAN
jgi:hypothetical protein